MNVMLAELRPDQSAAPTLRKRVVIVGGGFSGVNAARALRHADADTVLTCPSVQHETYRDYLS